MGKLSLSEHIQLYINMVNYYQELIDNEEQSLQQMFADEKTDALDLNIHDITNNLMEFNNKIDFCVKQLQLLYEHNGEYHTKQIRRFKALIR